MGGRAGLDYAAVKATAEIIDVELDDETFGLLQMVEAERLTSWADEEKKREETKKALTWEAPPDKAVIVGPSGQGAAFKKLNQREDE